MVCIGCIVQARYSSSRLPGKVLIKLKDDFTSLDYIHTRLKDCESFNPKNIIFAINDDNILYNEKLKNFMKNKGYEFYNNVFIEMNDVITRYYACAKEYMFEHIIRITGDCPFVDPLVVDKVVNEYKKNIDNCSYCSNVLIRSFPKGLDVEIFSYNALSYVKWLKNLSDYDSEHVTTYMRRNDDGLFDNNINVYASKNYYAPSLNISLDTQKDLDFIKSIVKNKPINFDIKEVIKGFMKK